MKKCDSPGCKSPRVFFNRAFGHKVCLSCRMTYHSHLDFSRIPEAKQVKEAIATNSLWLNAILTHTNTYPIEDLYKGLKEELRDFIIKNEEFRNRLDEAEENDNDGEITKIEEDVFELKRQIDSSEMMRNFTFHRFQINMDCAAKGAMNEEMEEDTQVKRLLIIAKEIMAQDFKRRFEEKFNQKNEELKRDYEENYKAQIEEYKTKILLQDTAIENQKKELIEIKDSIKEKEKTNDKLIEESKAKEAKIESLIEESNLNCKRFFEFYKDKTGNAITDKFEDINFSLEINNDAHKQVISVAKLFKLPPIRKLRFDYCENRKADLLEFLKHSSPTSTKLVSFGWSQSSYHKSIDYYVEGLEVAFKGATQEIAMNARIQSKESFQRLVKAGARATKFIFRAFKNSLDSDLDFTGPEYKIQYFGLPYCGNHQGENWSGQPEKLERIIKAFSQCGIKDSLQTLNVFQCGVAVDKVKQMLIDYGMQAVNVVEEDNAPTD